MKTSKKKSKSGAGRKAGPLLSQPVLASRPQPWFFYVVRADAKWLYAGITLDVERRFREHVEGTGKGSKFLRAHSRLELVFQCEAGDKSSALKLEYRFKRLPKAAKERVVKTGKLEWDD